MTDAKDNLWKTELSSKKQTRMINNVISFLFMGYSPSPVSSPPVISRFVVVMTRTS